MRKYWDSKDDFRPFVAGGLTVISGKLMASEYVSGYRDDIRSVDELGEWLEVGTIKNQDGYTFGVNIKWSTATILLNDVKVEGGGLQLGLLLGYQWQ